MLCNKLEDQKDFNLMLFLALVGLRGAQGYLAENKAPPPRTLR